MKNNVNKRTKISHQKGEIWDTKVGFFRTKLLLTPDIPFESFYVKYKIVLN